MEDFTELKLNRQGDMDSKFPVKWRWRHCEVLPSDSIGSQNAGIHWENLR